jgi:hypothetical protein
VQSFPTPWDFVNEKLKRVDGAKNKEMTQLINFAIALGFKLKATASRPQEVHEFAMNC